MRTATGAICFVAFGIAVLLAILCVPTAFFDWCAQPNEDFHCPPGGYDEAAVARVWFTGSLIVAGVSWWLGSYLRRGRG